MRALWIVESSGGGTARHVMEFSAGLGGYGVEVHVIYNPKRMDPLWNQLKPWAEAHGVHFHPLTMQTYPHPADLGCLFALRRYAVQKGPFHLVHGHSSKGGILARALRALGGPPAVYTPHAFAAFRGGLWGKAASWGERILVSYTDALIAVSPEELRLAIQLGYPQDRVHLIPNGLNPATFIPMPREIARHKLGFSADDLLVGFVGRLSKQKNAGLLLRAFSDVAPLVPEAILVFAGEGPEQTTLERESRALGLDTRVHFLGFRPSEEVLPALDLFVLPSEYEGFPYVLIEALFVGLPVLATRVGGAALAVSHGENGWLVPIGDRAALSGAMYKILRDPYERSRMALASRNRATQFLLRRSLVSLLHLYEGLARY